MLLYLALKGGLLMPKELISKEFYLERSNDYTDMIAILTDEREAEQKALAEYEQDAAELDNVYLPVSFWKVLMDIDKA